MLDDDSEPRSSSTHELLDEEDEVRREARLAQQRVDRNGREGAAGGEGGSAKEVLGSRGAAPAARAAWHGSDATPATAAAACPGTIVDSDRQRGGRVPGIPRRPHCSLRVVQRHSVQGDSGHVQRFVTGPTHAR